MKTLKTIFMLLILVLTVMSVSAELVVNKYTNDFTLSSPYNEQLKLCACETKVDTLIVENVGSFDTHYTAYIESNYPGKIRVEEKQFSLAPKHYREIVVYIEDSCNLVGTWKYDVVVKSNYGRIERLSRTINSQICQTSLMDVQPRHVEVGLCEPAEFTVTLENVGTYADTFKLDFGPFNDIAEPENWQVYILPDQEYEQEISFTWPCEVYGDFIIPFVMTTESGTPGAYQEATVTVRNEYDFSFEFDTSIEACALTETHFPLVVNNEAPVEDSFQLSLNGPGFLSIDGERVKELTLNSDESREVSLIVTPGKQDIGEHEFTINARDKYGGIQKSRDIDVKVSNCFDPAVSMMADEINVATEPVVTCCGPQTYFVNVQNNGDREQVFRLEVLGPSFFTLDETTVRVAPSQNLNVPIRANLPCSDESYDFGVKVSPIQNSELAVEDYMTIESQTQRTCHMVQIDDDELAVRETDSILPVLVKHTGIEGGIYSINMDSELFSVQEESLELVPGEQAVIHLEPTVNLTEQSKGRYVLQPQFTLEELNIDYNEHVGVQLRGKGLWQSAKDWFFGLPWCAPGTCGYFAIALFIVLIALVIVLLLLWFGVFSLFKEGLPLSILTALKTLLVILILVVLLALLFVPGPHASDEFERLADNQDATVLEWYQNQEYTIDLDQYFEDPDMDVLSYRASQPRDVNVQIEGNIMTLEPDMNWAGENTLVVTAMDGKGGIADSPLFLLRVISEKPVSFWEWIQMWCAQIVLGLLLLILLAILLVILTIKEERRGDDSDNNVIVVVPGAPKKKPRRKKASTRTVATAAKRNKYRLYASKTGTKAHKHDCMALENVRKKDMVEYKSRATVLKAGLALCSICHDVEKRKLGKKTTVKKTDSKKTSKKSVKKTVRKVAKKGKKKAVKVSKNSARKTAKKTVRKSAKPKKAKRTSKKQVRVPSKRNATAVMTQPMPPPPSKDDKTINVQLNIKQ